MSRIRNRIKSISGKRKPESNSSIRWSCISPDLEKKAFYKGEKYLGEKTT